MSCHRVIDGLWESCLPFFYILQQRALITSPLYWCCQLQCDMHHVCGENGFYHLVDRPVQYHCTQCHQLKMHCHQSRVISPGGSRPLGIHVFTHLFTLTHSLKWIWFWLMNSHTWTDLLFNQYLLFVCLFLMEFNLKLCVHPKEKNN